MVLSEFEKQRQENIARNKELLKKLNLTALASEFHKYSDDHRKFRPIPKSKSKSKKHEKVTKVPSVPLRRSTRLAGVKMDDAESSEIVDKMNNDRLERERIKELESTRLTDDLKLSDLVTDSATLSRLGSSFSTGDFYNELKSKPLVSKTDEQAREELDKLELYENFHPNHIKLTNSRMTSVTFHPSNTRKVVIGGDTNGTMGIWSVDDDTEVEPAITQFSAHRKNIPRFAIRPEAMNEVVSCSYDGSVRILDLQKGISKCVVEFDDMWGDAAGVSDIKFISKDVGYLTTLGGEFSIFDLRSAVVKRDVCKVWRLHDKKIGSFTVCPTDDKLIASASLDRTLRIWDLRVIRKQKWSDYEDAQGPECLAGYRSRLSVSCADWNGKGDIVCNGYDDSIRIFNLDKGDGLLNGLKGLVKPEINEIPENLDPNVTIKHNCQTGRWVSILKSKWQDNPRDGVEKFVIGNMKKYFDVYNRTGAMLAHFGDERMTSVPAVCCFHPTENWIVGGNSSGKAFLLS